MLVLVMVLMRVLMLVLISSLMLMLTVVLMLVLVDFLMFGHRFGHRLAMAGNQKSAIAALELLGRMRDEGRPTCTDIHIPGNAGTNAEQYSSVINIHQEEGGTKVTLLKCLHFRCWSDVKLCEFLGLDHSQCGQSK